MVRAIATNLCHNGGQINSENKTRGHTFPSPLKMAVSGGRAIRSRTEMNRPHSEKDVLANELSPGFRFALKPLGLGKGHHRRMTISSQRRIHLCLSFFLVFAAMEIRLPAQATGATKDNFFNPNHVLEVQITMTPANWESLRLQERDAKAEFARDRLTHPPAKPYTWFPADVVVDGVQLTNVGVRKRGFFGSADKDRPALNIDLNRFVKGQRFAGRSELKLHNNKQDGTNVRQILAYGLFRTAGVPAPRCGLAQVTVNGKKLGLFSNLEPIDDAFLKRQFGSDKGNLYEAQISDFRPGWTGTFEKKNKKSGGREDLEAVVEALKSDDADLLERLGRVLDVDAFISFWAMEGLINHWDGFSGDQNNCFVYHDPKSDKLRFIAWGADATFGPRNIFVPFEPPASVWAVSYLTRRLYNHPVTREKYRQRMRELLATVWDEKQLNSEVDELSDVMKGRSTVPLFQAGMEAGQLRQFINKRRGAIEEDLAKPAEPWTHPMRREIYSAVVGKISADFSCAWVASVRAPAPAGAIAHIKLDFYGRHLTGEFTDVKAMPDILNPHNSAISFTGSFPGVEVPVSIWVSAKTNLFLGGARLTPGPSESVVVLVAGQIGKPDFRVLGTWETGSVKLDHVEKIPGEKVSGNLEAEISTTPWEDFDLAKLKKSR
jgi:spore coat protein CotH